jgi:hypothetical protein
MWAWWKALIGRRESTDKRRYVRVRRCNRVTTDPPPMQWAPCHPSTMRRFKASMTCPKGHGLTLTKHSIAATGEVSPSVVCPSPGCSFHEYVRLDRWSFGPLS